MPENVSPFPERLLCLQEKFLPQRINPRLQSDCERHCCTHNNVKYDRAQTESVSEKEKSTHNQSVSTRPSRL